MVRFEYTFPRRRKNRADANHHESTRPGALITSEVLKPFHDTRKGKEGKDE